MRARRSLHAQSRALLARSVLLATVLAAVATTAACGSDSPDRSQASVASEKEDGAGQPAPSRANPAPDVAGKLVVGKCPLGADDVAKAVGQRLTSDPDGTGMACEFSDGTASVVVIVGGGELSSDREYLSGSGREVTDLARGEDGYLATKGDKVNAAADFGEVSLGIAMHGLGQDRARHEKISLALIDAAVT
jgi:hypothetical protein